MDINQVQYGNPPIHLLQFINGHSYLDILYSECIQHTFPANDSNIVRQELDDIITKMMYIQSHENTEVLQRYRGYDYSMMDYYIKNVSFEAEEHVQQYHKLIADVYDDVLPLVFKLKQYFQRPRPGQLAHYLKMKIFPFHTHTGDNPSYPCLHSCLARVLAGVLCSHYPETTQWCYTTGRDVATSRVFLGLNFQSSVDAGIRVAERILINKEFQVKYGL